MEETEQASDPDTVGVLELSDQEFITTMYNMLRAPMGKVKSMKEQMGNVSIKMEILRKKQKAF